VAVLLTVLRLLQGIGVGGEWCGSVLLSMEWARHNNERGFLSSWPPIRRARRPVFGQPGRSHLQPDVGR